MCYSVINFFIVFSEIVEKFLQIIVKTRLIVKMLRCHSYFQLYIC